MAQTVSTTNTPQTRAQAKVQAEMDAFFLRCMTDYEYFALSCLKIKTKTEGIKPLVFNKAQQYLHAVAELMIERFGKVRIIIVKARQQGLSTYVEGRGYWKTSQNHDIKAYILTHENNATKNLFDMAKRYHENCPAELRPITKRSNQKELIFDKLGSEYAVGTAKTGDTGRSQCFQFLHGSEVAFWRSAEDIAGGLMEGVPDEPGTEIYLESTAYGASGYFPSQWNNACNPDDDIPRDWNGYWRVFIPWFWDDGYHMELPKVFEIDDDEVEIKMLYDLSDEQIYWRRRKIITLKNDLSKFQREYPANPAEAFNNSLTNVLIDAKVVLAAMLAGKTNKYEPMGRKILGVDVAREGDDDTCLVLRQGRVILWYRRLSKLTTTEVADAVMHTLASDHVEHVCVDATGGYGAGVYDVLVAMGVGQRVTAVNFAHKAIDKERYKNRRAEMYFALKMWLEQGAGIPNRDELLTELCAITYKHESTGDRLILERKDEIKARIGKSTDISDAAALTFCAGSSIIGSSMQQSFDPFTFFGDV